MKEILEEVVALLSRGESGALATILTASGSLPMSRRSKLVVRGDGTLAGTVGGGCLEAEVVSLGSRLAREGRAAIRRFTLTEEKAGAEGLNCGGTVEILIEPIGARVEAERPSDAALFGAALRAIADNEEMVLATAIQGEDPCRIAGRALIGWKGLRQSTGALADPGAALAGFAVEEALAILGQDRAALVSPPPESTGAEGAGIRLLLETISAPPTLYLFGGGHVSLAVARVARTAGFRIVVVDDRPAFADPARFPEADRTLTLPLDAAMARLPIDRNSYIVAATRGHQYDEPVVEQALATQARYIGMLGSRRKVAILWKRMKERGIPDEALARVKAPIGLPIGADTPGEIAVSIVAQLIEARRGEGG